ncbi:MAG: RsmB/NOP family class I SAM-dependent RNA methyltransferase [Blautia sp.]|jgi:NOL1/NOP2/sun family putative RNA methylase
MNLPSEFLARMEEMLGDEYTDFLDSYDAPRHYGLRINTLKITEEEFQKIAPFPITPVPWAPGGYFYPGDCRPARHPYYQAGLYYLQEPSAMAPASILPVSPGEYVLDMCAAPGGKATALGARLGGKGLLVANDISASRAKALLRNLELFGVSNAFVTNEVPARLVPRFPEFFHKILLDAPCSGEGMFRKEPEVAASWYPKRPFELAAIQRALITQAVEMLRPGGLLLYSTCTFSPEENEGTIAYLLQQCPQMELLPIDSYEGFSPGVPAWGGGDERLTGCARIWPHKMDGEGHFLCLLRKPGSLSKASSQVRTKLDREASRLLEGFFGEIRQDFPLSRMETRGEKAYLLPDASYPVKGIKFLRNGLYLGDVKKNRFEPSQQLAMALQAGSYPHTFTLAPDDPRIQRYLRGETLLLTEEEAASLQGWTLLCAGAYPLGFGKVVGHNLKNKYAAGWRQQA